MKLRFGRADGDFALRNPTTDKKVGYCLDPVKTATMKPLFKVENKVGQNLND